MWLSNFSPTGFFPEAMSHLIIALICGGVIGLDRQLRGKPIGIRGCTIVVITTAMLVDLGNAATDQTGDPSRMMSAIVTGVGFLGAGVIMSQGGRVQGVTTAALVWALAAIGIAIGLSFGLAALVLTLTIMVLMMATDWAERRFPRLRPSARTGKE